MGCILLSQEARVRIALQSYAFARVSNCADSFLTVCNSLTQPPNQPGNCLNGTDRAIPASASQDRQCRGCQQHHALWPSTHAANGGRGRSTGAMQGACHGLAWASSGWEGASVRSLYMYYVCSSEQPVEYKPGSSHCASLTRRAELFVCLWNHRLCISPPTR